MVGSNKGIPSLTVQNWFAMKIERERRAHAFSTLKAWMLRKTLRGTNCSTECVWGKGEVEGRGGDTGWCWGLYSIDRFP